MVVRNADGQILPLSLSNWQYPWKASTRNTLFYNMWTNPFQSKLSINPVQRVHMSLFNRRIFKRPDVLPRTRSVKLSFSLIFLENLYQLTPTLTFDFTLTIISNSLVCNSFLWWKNHYFSYYKNRDNPCKSPLSG